MIYDITTFNGEYDLFDLRYNLLKDHVDEFIVVEFDKTFSGEHKPWYFAEKSLEYPKVKWFLKLEKEYEKYRELAESSPNTAGAAHWTREFMQKESIKDALTHLKDEDIVFIGDVDEIWQPEALELSIHEPLKLKLDVYTYYLNNRSTEQFWGSVVSEYRYIKDQCLNHLRTNAVKTPTTYGWHFTSMGGPLSLRKKLTDSYTQESYATPEVLANLEYNIEHGRDFLGRSFSYTLDESDWPEYLKRNKEQYKHLCR